MSEILSSRYDYTTVEPDIYAKWQQNKCFQSAVDQQDKVQDEKRAGKPTHVIAIPPPNVTGRLHMGHALNNTIQDMLTRYKRMDGYDALWVPGTDHAGIATQTVVKKMLDAEGIDYRELGREKFIEKVWTWKEKFGNIILTQLEKLGCSCDWDRTRFTMDEGLSQAVGRAFKALYDQGLIYRGLRIVNWCPVDRTALSDDEIETKEGGEPGFLWHIDYPFEDGSGKVTVATTRPETMFGDTAVAVNPNDDRWKSIIGKNVILPLMNKPIPVIADEYVDMEFGSGCLKITPAHDPNDFEIGTKHKLEAINIMNEDATMNDVVPERFRGLDRDECRKVTIEALKEEGLLVQEEPRMTPVGRSYRSKAIIEYRLSEQWFVKMKPLAEKALARHDELNIKPERWDKVYRYWLENIRDWCISRQIWWGHRIPAWYHKETGEVLVEEKTPQAVLDNPDDWRQDEDVLDTWFSSGLWPMSILGWPEESPDLKRYFPTTTLSTAKDIIFFWVARMNIMALNFRDKFPYQNVYIHPTVMDARGETMSKSKGNGIDPLHIIAGSTASDLKEPILDARPSNMNKLIKDIDKHFPEGFPGVGADAMRYTLISLCSSGQELKLSMDSFVELGRRFMTKLWNAARFIMLNIDSYQPSGKDIDLRHSEAIEDTWILGRLKTAVKNIRESYDSFNFIHIGSQYYQFIWNDFCDWYIEISKVRLDSKDETVKAQALHKLLYVFSRSLMLMHPLIPFVTEELWSKLLPLADEKKLWDEARPSSDILMREEFPAAEEVSKEEEQTMTQFEILTSFISSIRSFRANYNIANKTTLSVNYKALNPEAEKHIAASIGIINKLAGIEKNEAVDSKPLGTSAIILKNCEIYVPLKGLIDIKEEVKRIEKELKKATDDLAFNIKKLSNPKFIENAKAELVEQARSAKDFVEKKIESLKKALSELGD